MAKNGFDMVEDVRSLVNVQSVLDILDGGTVDPSVKRTKGDVKGVVVNSTVLTNDQDQVGYGSINCYAPPVETTVKGNVVQLPDQSTLSALVRLVTQLVDGVYMPTFRTWITDTGVILKDTDGSYFASIEYRYQSIQDNYKRI